MPGIKLKICGVKTVEEAKQLKDSGIDFAGLNFVPSSSRCISQETAKQILDVLQGGTIETIALFQNQPLETVNDYARQLGIDYVQLHGDEPADYAQAIEVPVMKAIAVDPAASAGKAVDLINTYPADYFVLDRQRQGQGEPLNAGLAAQIIAAQPGMIFLAGGLNPDNLAALLAQASPYGIDISSGVRTDDAIDMAKVSQCLDIIRSARSSQR